MNRYIISFTIYGKNASASMLAVDAPTIAEAVKIAEAHIELSTPEGQYGISAAVPLKTLTDFSQAAGLITGE